MYNIAIVGDLHIDTKVSSRKDDYFQTCLNKITEVCENCNNVIILGDVFNRPTLSNEYFTQLYTHLSYLKSRGVSFYSIMGNHDLYNEDETSLSKTCLGICDLIGLIKVIRPEYPINICGINFYTSYVNFNKAKDHLKTLKLQESDVLLLHHFYEDCSNSFSYDDLKLIGCKNIFLGHEHTPFEHLRRVTNSFTVYRCGSLLRNIANEANLKRDIFYFVMNDTINPCKLESALPAKEVFIEKAYTQQNLNRRKFVTNINDVILKYTNNINTESKFSIKSILEEIKTPKQSMEYIKKKYTDINEVFN